MFKHFVGNIYILEKPPQPTDTQLDLTFPDELLADVDENEFKQELTKEQVAKIIHYKEQMAAVLGGDVFNRLQREGLLMSSDMSLLSDIAMEISHNANRWRGLGYLNSKTTEYWSWILPKVLKLSPGIWDCPYGKFVEFIKILSTNWEQMIPELLDQLDTLDITIEQFFKLERNATFKLSALLSDINVLQKEILGNQSHDISPFIAKLSRAFLPSCVFELEEYGLPRMITKKIHAAGIIDFSNDDLTLHDAIEKLNQSKMVVYEKTNDLDRFDHYVLDYFYEGIGKR